MRFATTHRVWTEDIAPSDTEAIRRVLHAILDEQIDKYISILSVDLKQSDRIATVDIRTFKHEGDADPPIIVKPNEVAFVRGAEKKILLPPGTKRNSRLSS